MVRTLVSNKRYTSIDPTIYCNNRLCPALAEPVMKLKKYFISVLYLYVAQRGRYSFWHVAIGKHKSNLVNTKPLNQSYLWNQNEYRNLFTNLKMWHVLRSRSRLMYCKSTYHLDFYIYHKALFLLFQLWTKIWLMKSTVDLLKLCCIAFPINHFVSLSL